MESTRRYIGIDVGGTKVLGLVCDPTTGEIEARARAATPKHDPSLVPEAIVDVARQLIEQTGSPVAIGCGIPGLVDHQGVLRYGPNVQGVLNLDIAGRLRREFNIPAVAENDASCAALAEHRLGAAKGHDHVILVTQGTGIGGALIMAGRLVRGANGFAGEPGHMLVDRSGPTCACGQKGCWEAVASGTGLANLARVIVTEGRGQRIVEIAGGEPGLIRGEHVAAAHAEGDRDALEVLDRFATWVAQGIASLVVLLDPDLVVLGGGLTSINQSFMSEVRERLPGATMGGDHRPRVPVVPAQLGPEAGAIGAALNARTLFRSE